MLALSQNTPIATIPFDFIASAMDVMSERAGISIETIVAELGPQIPSTSILPPPLPKMPAPSTSYAGFFELQHDFEAAAGSYKVARKSFEQNFLKTRHAAGAKFQYDRSLPLLSVYSGHNFSDLGELDVLEKMEDTVLGINARAFSLSSPDLQHLGILGYHAWQLTRNRELQKFPHVKQHYREIAFMGSDYHALADIISHFPSIAQSGRLKELGLQLNHLYAQILSPLAYRFLGNVDSGSNLFK